MRAQEPFDLLVVGARAVVTADGPEGDDAERMLDVLPGAVVGIRGTTVEYLGPGAGLPAARLGAGTRRLDAEGGLVVPGFVDAHTHLVFAGDRAREFEQRAGGGDYLAIAAAGGGIAATMRATRAASEEELTRLALPRLARLLGQGITTAEVKSGYGLTVEGELKLLRTIRELDGLQPVSLVPTLLCAHATPPEFEGDPRGYLALCRRELLPRVAEEGLARFCDAFVGAGAFSADEVRPFLEDARARGLLLRLHVDQLTPGRGAEFAAALGAASADHLECVSDEGIAALAGAGVTAVLVPVATLFLRGPRYAPGRRLRAAGVPVALATNVNPGSAMSENLALTLGLAVLENGLTADEALLGVTRWGGRALRLPDAGRLRVGGPADLVVLGCAEVRHLPYHLGISHVRAVVKAGRTVHADPGAAHCV